MFVPSTFSLVSVSAAAILFGLVTFEQSVAQDVGHICSEKYQSAKAAGTLNGETWPQFYSRCTTEAKANAAVLGYNYPGSRWYGDAYALVTGGGSPATASEGWFSRFVSGAL